MDRRVSTGDALKPSRIAGLAAVATTAVLAFLRTGTLGVRTSVTPEELLPLLTATALLCVLGLAREHDSVAWLSTVGASVIVTVDLAGYAGSVRGDVAPGVWVWLVIAVCLAALVVTGSSAGYAISRGRLPRPWIAIAGFAAIAIVAAACVVAVATASDRVAVASPGSPLGNARFVTRAILLLVPLLTVVGVVGDALPPAERARRRVAMQGLTGHGRRARIGAWIRAFADEVGPGRTTARRAVLAERSRIARDLHADVVPALRQAVRDAERDARAESLAETLRQVIAEVEALGTERHAVQLEIGGLVAALEWLAERVESRSGVRVMLNVADPGSIGSGAPPGDVAAAAFRVAGLALDNVVRHAPGSRAEVSVRADATVVDLRVRDDGPGLRADALTSALARGRRGVADMVSEAAACGAVVDLQPAAGGIGTTVRFSWQTPSRQAH